MATTVCVEVVVDNGRTDGRMDGWMDGRTGGRDKKSVGVNSGSKQIGGGVHALCGFGGDRWDGGSGRS